MSFQRCPITDFVVEHYGFASNTHGYNIDIDGLKVGIALPHDYLDWDHDTTYKENKYIIAGLLLNQKLFDFGKNGTYFRLTLEYIKKQLAESSYPTTPSEKYDNLFTKLFSLQTYDGELIEYMERINPQTYYKKNYFKDEGELNFYAKTLDKNGLISLTFNNSLDSIVDYSITFRGLQYSLKLETEGKQSKNCFIAMSFSEGMGDIRAAIKDACTVTGYTAVIVDEIHHDSDTTINDAIIANLKKSRFCIADFTEQKKGVYFESGFALGQGKQVIYSCRNDSFIESHFDTNHFPHILYNTPEELKERLVNKIEAWIR